MLTFLPATESAADVISALAHRIWPVSYADILAPEHIENLLERIYTPDALRQQMHAGEQFWLVRLAGETIGYISCIHEAPTLWAKKLYLLPEHQGKGYGNQLMQFIIAQKQPSETQLQLYVNNGNARAIAAYERMGLQKLREEPVQMGDYHFVDWVMGKAI